MRHLEGEEEKTKQYKNHYSPRIDAVYHGEYNKSRRIFLIVEECVIYV